jgi:hypothetical protein
MYRPSWRRGTVDPVISSATQVSHPQFEVNQTLWIEDYERSIRNTISAPKE